MEDLIKSQVELPDAVLAQYDLGQVYLTVERPATSGRREATPRSGPSWTWRDTRRSGRLLG
jgi:hypothetical protein